MAKNWYVVHTYSGYEEKTKLTIEGKAQFGHLEDKIGRILIPTEKVIEIKNGKKKESDKKFYPGYVLIEMELDEETWHLVRNTPRVSGFVGGEKPIPIPEEEIAQILQQLEKGPTTQVRTQFTPGEVVRIIDGPFSNFTGSIENVDMDHGRLRVMVSIFGRQTPVELNFFQVEKG